MTDLAVASTFAPTPPAPTPAVSSAPPRSGDHFNRVLERVRHQGGRNRADPPGIGRSPTGSGTASRADHPTGGDDPEDDAVDARSAGNADATGERTTAAATTAASGHGVALSRPPEVEPPVPPAHSSAATAGEAGTVATPPAPAVPAALVPDPDPAPVPAPAPAPAGQAAIDPAQLSPEPDASVPEAASLPSASPGREPQAAPVLSRAVLPTPHLDQIPASGTTSIVAPTDAPTSGEPAADLEAPLPALATDADRTDPVAAMPQLMVPSAGAPAWIAAAVLPAPQPQTQAAPMPDGTTTDSVAGTTTTPPTTPAAQAPAPVADEPGSVDQLPVAEPAPPVTAAPNAPEPATAQAPATPAAWEPPSATAPSAPIGFGPLTSAPVRPDVSTVTTSTVPAPPPEAEPWQQVHQALGSLRSFSDGSEQIRVRLHPEELGEVLVEVTALRGELRINLVTETPAARDRLNAELGQLASRLADSGLHASSLDVGSGGDGGRPGGERHQRGADARAGSPVELRLPVSAGARSTRSGGTGRIDLVL